MKHKHHVVPLFTCTTCTENKKGKRVHRIGMCPLQVPENIVLLTVSDLVYETARNKSIKLPVKQVDFQW